MYFSFVVKQQTYPNKKMSIKMVSVRFTSFLIMVVSLLVKGDSSSLTHQEKILHANNRSRVVVAGMSPMNVVKGNSYLARAMKEKFSEEIYDGVPSATEVKNPKVGGRKMMIKRLFGRVKEEDNDGRDSRTSGVVNSVRHRNTRGKVNSMVERQPRNESRRRLKVNMSGFIAFNADYHVPKPHPPKNN